MSKPNRYNAEERAAEKAASREEDQRQLDAGEVTRSELRRKNCLSWAGGSIDWDNSELS
jgi:hypothetical protein